MFQPLLHENLLNYYKIKKKKKQPPQIYHFGLYLILLPTLFTQIIYKLQAIETQLSKCRENSHEDRKRRETSHNRITSLWRVEI